MAGTAGDDREGEILVRLLREEHIDTDALVLDPKRPTTSKTRVMSGGHQLIRLDREITAPVSDDLQERIVGGIRAVIRDVDVVVMEDYNKGVLTVSKEQRANWRDMLQGLPILKELPPAPRRGME